MLTGKLPYGIKVSQARSRLAQSKLRYDSALAPDREIPAWIDEVIKKAIQPNPQKRYQELSEFILDLRQPNKAFLNKTRPPLLERNPLLFWKSVYFLLALAVVALLLLRQYASQLPVQRLRDRPPYFLTSDPKDNLYPCKTEANQR